MELIFNELSLLPLAVSPENAREKIEQFLKTVRSACQKGVSRQLRTQEEIRNVTLAPEYTWRDWQRDTKVPREQRQYFLGLATRSPLLDGLDELRKKEPEFEFHHADQPAFGLGVAYLSHNLAVSLLSEERWDGQWVDLDVKQLGDDSEIHPFHTRIPHASRPDHIEFHDREVIQPRLRGDITSGTDLWNQASVLFPSLLFCTAVENQMHDLPREALGPILRGLFCLERYCQRWHQGGFNQSALGCASTSESEGTKGQFAAERTFVCPDGKTRLFLYHVKPGQPWRIHYEPSVGPGKMFIGYVGKHLPTVRHH
ncbi:hypothetical protein SIID45300_03066 [Candidatus Magnetaquicoccaceae bacterium FCR-1]|uniref:Uncharacterized protein n=1 Tax=Candidatus Magnetaquiglobus chichijimensis TaxID=3141448 RepID=A0ABQ0CCU0_9PROT